MNLNKYLGGDLTPYIFLVKCFNYFTITALAHIIIFPIVTKQKNILSKVIICNLMAWIVAMITMFMVIGAYVFYIMIASYGKPL